MPFKGGGDVAVQLVGNHVDSTVNNPIEAVAHWRGGKLKPDCRQTWANYYCRYIREYEKEGIPIWGVSVQNEPEATQAWESCIYAGEEERDFVRDFLGPALEREGLANIRVVIWEHNRDRMYERGSGRIFGRFQRTF